MSRIENIDWPAVRQCLLDLRKAHGLPEPKLFPPDDGWTTRLHLLPDGIDLETTLNELDTLVYVCRHGEQMREQARASPPARAEREAEKAALKKALDACRAAVDALDALPSAAKGRVEWWLENELAGDFYRARKSTFFTEGGAFAVYRRLNKLVADCIGASRPRPGAIGTGKQWAAESLVEILRRYLLLIPRQTPTLELSRMLFGERLDMINAIADAYESIRPEEIFAWLLRQGKDPEDILDREARLAAIREAYVALYDKPSRKHTKTSRKKTKTSRKIDLDPILEADLLRIVWGTAPCKSAVCVNICPHFPTCPARHPGLSQD